MWGTHVIHVMCLHSPGNNSTIMAKHCDSKGTGPRDRLLAGSRARVRAIFIEVQRSYYNIAELSKKKQDKQLDPRDTGTNCKIQGESC